MGEFVHLHLHSEYSLLDGACRVADIPRAAKEAGHTAVAMTTASFMVPWRITVPVKRRGLNRSSDVKYMSRVIPVFPKRVKMIFRETT